MLEIAMAAECAEYCISKTAGDRHFVEQSVYLQSLFQRTMNRIWPMASRMVRC